jgi:uncharacterized membrane protein YeaQ/YmgE (transglycosylase-associated protein family)
MSILAWLVVGLIAGFLASKVVNKTGEGLVLDCTSSEVLRQVGFGFSGESASSGVDI